MKSPKTLFSGIVLLILVVCWVMAGWALNLEDYTAPELMIFFGRFHPMVLHTPIGLMVLALLLDLGLLLPERFRKKIPNTTWLHCLVVLTSTGAVIHGILLFASGGYEGSELAERHLIGGCIFLTVAGVIFLFKAWVQSARLSRLVGAPLTLASITVLCISTHDGASLTHGEKYLSQYAPETLKPFLEPGYEKPAPKEEREKGISEPSFTDENVYEVAVQPIFDRVCVSCHKESKSKA